MAEEQGPVAPFDAGDVEALLRPARQTVVDAVAMFGFSDGGGSFSIDPERAEECIRGLRGVALHLLETQILIGHTGFPPPGRDEVSVNVANQAGVMAQRAESFIIAWRRQLEEIADALEQQLATYLAVDDENRARLT